ncbi:MAG: hypothetical protein SFU55_06915 [Methylophilus sp.]|nr:hypothetical protein [Methylophilus sp.]
MLYLKLAILSLLLALSSATFAGLKDANRYYQNKQYQSAIVQYMPLAKSGNAEAQTRLGVIYTFGYGVKIDYLKALSFFEQAKSKNNPEATYWYAQLLLNGLGIEKSPEKSLVWFEKSANQGYVDAQNVLGIMYMQGVGVKQDYETAFNWNTKAAIGGNPESMYNLGQQYEKGVGVAQDNKQSVYWYEKSAKHHHALAEFEMGYAYSEGVGGLPKDLNLAIGWYTKAAKQGGVPAQHNLANVYFEQADQLSGDDRQAKLLEGVKWLQKAADQDDHRSLYELSDFYFRGVGVAKNEEYGLRLLTKAADKGYVLAQKKLGTYQLQKKPQQMALKDGKLVKNTPENQEMLSKAIKNWELAAEKGGKIAIKELAFAYQDGLGVKRDYLKAAEYYIKLYQDGEKLDYFVFSKFQKLYRKGLAGDSQAMRANELVEQAAEAGNTALMRFVGQCHCGQFGKVDVENKDFLDWYLKAANKGDVKAKWLLANLHAGKKEYEQAAKRYQEIADMPDMDVAKYNLAMMYIYGKGVEKSEPKAKELLLKIKDITEDNPQLALARLYTNGGVQVKNLAKAQESYLLIANRQQYFPNNPDLIEASGRLSEMYLSGSSGLKDEKQAYFWKVLQLESVANENSLRMQGEVESGDCFHLEGGGFYGRPFEFVKAQQMDVNKSELVRFKEKLSADEVKRIDLEVKQWIEAHKTFDTKVKIN